MKPLPRVLHWTEAQAPLWGLALLRVIVGFMLWRQTLVYVRRYLNQGFFREVFHWPYWESYPLPNEWGYVFLLFLLWGCGAALILGWRTRWALGLATAGTFYHLFLNQLWYHNNSYFLSLLLVLLSFSPCDRVLALDARRFCQEAIGPVWTLGLIRLQISLIYLASSLSKWLDPAWRGGEVLWQRSLTWAEKGQTWGAIPEWLWAILTRRELWEAMTIGALSTEVFLAIGLWWKPLRHWALWAGLLFHGYVELTYSVIAFSYLSLATYFAFMAEPSQSRRFYWNPQIGGQARLALWLGRLDWLRRWQWIPQAGSQMRVEVAEKQWRGKAAWMILGSALPLTFVLCYPVAIWLEKHMKPDFQTTSKGQEKSLEELHSGLHRPAWALGLVIFYTLFVLLTSGLFGGSLPFRWLKWIDLVFIFILLEAIAGRRFQNQS